MTPTTAIQRAEQWRKENACGEAAKVAIALLNELQALQAKQEKELIALHAKLAGETLRADQGWQRYEAANEARNRAEEECARAWGIVTMNRAIPEGHVVVPGWLPIESAPKGSGLGKLTTDPDYVKPPSILLLFEEGKIAVGYWDWYYAEGGRGYEGGLAWISPEAGERLDLHYDAPIGWMPLPAAPANKEGT